MTKSISNDIVKPDGSKIMAIRERIVVDASRDFTRKVKIAALESDLTLREAVLLSLGEKFPQLMKDALKELEK